MQVTNVLACAVAADLNMLQQEGGARTVAGDAIPCQRVSRQATPHAIARRARARVMCIGLLRDSRYQASFSEMVKLLEAGRGAGRVP